MEESRRESEERSDDTEADSEALPELASDILRAWYCGGADWRLQCRCK